MENVTHKH